MATGQQRCELPELLLDRSLGSVAAPALLRAAGLRVATLVEVYGSAAAETIEDSTWLRDAAARGWPVLMKDPLIWHRPAERAALTAQGVTAFCLTGTNLTAAVLAEQVLNVLEEMARACARPGPALHVISASGMRTVPLDA